DGSYRFIGRVWRRITGSIDVIKGAEPYRGDGELNTAAKEIHRSTHKTIKKVTEDIDRRFHFNTAISAIMEHVNMLYKWEPKDVIDATVLREAVEAVVVLLSPFAPHVTEELWEMIGGEGVLHDRPWPSFDVSAIATEDVLVVVQISGKVRAKVTVPAGADKDTVEAIVVKNEDVIKWTDGKEIIKTIYIQDKIFNMVVK
ncbi:MAG: class I tRNA ligase family protein, partial [Deltaproteobacteria bacterium]|nr:class I tRNA ligase family protein [Deltaproteobacteria bacterium]